MKGYHSRMFNQFLLVLVTVVISMAFFSCAASPKDNNGTPDTTPLKAWIGMSTDQLKTLYPDLRPVEDSKERFSRSAKEFGLDGSWIYSFTNHKLHWFVFNASQTTISQPNFNACLSSTTEIINNYKEILGQPQRFRTGITSFNDPELKTHNGYMVEQATWESAIGRVKVDFSFLGENKAYEFLVSMQVSN